MPLYEYDCTECQARFEKLRPMSQAQAPAACTRCGSLETVRAISLFSAVSKNAAGDRRAVRGTGKSCGSCSASSCATCNH